MVHVREVDVILVIRAKSALEKLLPGIFLSAFLELSIVEAAFSTLFFKVKIEASLMEAMILLRSRAFEED